MPLNITRRLGQSFIINDDIKVTVVQLEKNEVRLAIQAPPNIRLDREEVWEKKQRGDDEQIQGEANGNRRD